MTGRFVIKEVPVNENGFELLARSSADVRDEDRTGDHATYTIELVPSEGFPADRPLVWSFSGEIERGVVALALHELADQLEKTPPEE